MAAYIELENSFADGTTRKLELGPFDSDAAVAHSIVLKNKIAQVNSDTSVIGDIYLSNGGASFTGITGADITIINKRTINLN